MNIFRAKSIIPMRRTQLITLLFFIALSQIYGQEEGVGRKIIKGYGQTFKVEEQDIKTNTELELKVIFDVSESPEDKSIMNKQIETAARFLNMHAIEGMKADQLKVALTIHGGAWQDILNNKAYKKLHGVNNPNAKLIEMLNEAGVDVILCGQTAAFRKIKEDDIIPEVKLALSAMTALLQYQNDGYRYIKF